MGDKMKILVILMFFFMFFISHAESTQSLLVKYDNSYYAPIVDVVKWDLILPSQIKSNYSINIILTQNQGVIFNETFFIDNPNIKGSIYFCRSPLTAIFINPKIKRKLMTGITVIINGKNKSIMSIIPLQNLQITIKKKSTMKFNQKTVIMELKNKFKYNSKCSPGIMKKYILGLPKRQQSKDILMKLSVTVINKKVKKNILLFDNYNLTNFSKEELIKLQKELVATRDKMLEKYKAGKINLKEVNKVQAKLIEINSKIEDSGK